MSERIRKHGLTRNTKHLVYEALFQRQQGKCAICGISQEEIEARLQARYDERRQLAEALPIESPHRQRWLAKIEKGPAPVHRKLHIDHCHWSGRIRGLLCERCNAQLGYLENFGFREKPDDMTDEDFARMCESTGRWLERHQDRLFQYMQRDRWLPTKDILFHLQAAEQD